MNFYLAWYEKMGERYLGEILLSGVDENKIQLEFGLQNYQGGTLEVTEKQSTWLTKQDINCQMDLYDYFVEVFD